MVPEGFDVELRGFSFMGGRSLRLKDVPIVPGSPRIIVRGFAVMGGIEVKSRPSRSARQLSRSENKQRWAELSSDLSTAALDRADYYMSDVVRDVRRELSDQLNHQRRSDRSDRSDRRGRPDPPGRSPRNDPVTESRATRSRPSDSTVTILFCDMVDYAGMTERLGDQASRRVLHEHHRIVRDALGQHDGREISVQGDGFMVAFGGVARAMRCAIAIQRSFREFVSPEAEAKVEVHIGIHTGDAVDEGDDYLGYTVIVASRLADAAAPGEILVSNLSEQLVQGSGEFVFDGHRETPLKGMTRPQPSATLSWAH
jgi:class 3 adenylate cyclase